MSVMVFQITLCGWYQLVTGDYTHKKPVMKKVVEKWRKNFTCHVVFMIATFNHVGGSFNLFMATTGDDWIIPSFRIWDYMLHVEHISCVIMNCGQHQWVIPSPLPIALKVLLEENTTRTILSLSLDLFFKILLFQVAFLIFYSIAIFSSYFLQVGLLLQSVALFQSKY